MAKIKDNPERARQIDIARKLMVDVFGDGPTTVIRVSGEASDQQGRIVVSSLEEFEKLMDHWDREDYAKSSRSARELFDYISRRLGPDTATEIFQSTAAKRLRGREYCGELNRALLFHITKTNSPTETARRAIEFGLERGKDQEKLIRRIERLLRKDRSSQTGDN
jgi:hypothetical protein